MMDKFDQIIVKFSSNYPNLFRNVSKSILYLNTLFSQETDEKFFIETIENGILYIYQNEQTFDILNPQTSPAEIMRLIKDNELQFNPEMLIDGIIDKQTFPETGLNFQYNIYCTNKQQVYNKLLEFHQSFFGENIKIGASAKYDLILTITDFDILYLFVQVIALMANGKISN